ncbi:lysophosphatidylcholine acyltransferase 1-like [Petromyzon marinus]|uniref:lysophosphatidylcholine acyltransferase 1-like n=1 Tax=Petromyzon marinus TaxID=7757 RepID=UPI003F71BC2B
MEATPRHRGRDGVGPTVGPGAPTEDGAPIPAEPLSESRCPDLHPFEHVIQYSRADKLRIGLMSVTLFPIRLLLAAFMMLLAWPFAFMASLWRTKANADQPFPWWLKLLDIPLISIMRGLWFVGGFHWVKVKGRPASTKEAPIVAVAPHSSYFDAIPVTMGMSSIVAKSESQEVPIWGTLIKYVQPVFVSRDDPNSRRNTVEEIKRRAATKGKWPPIMIFPEGTCTNRTCLIKFKPGAFIPGVPIQPVVLRYGNKMDTITWTWHGPTALQILWLTLCQPHNRIEIEFLPVYYPSDEEKRDPTLFGSNVRRIMARALRVPLSDVTLESYLAQRDRREASQDTAATEDVGALLRSLRLAAENGVERRVRAAGAPPASVEEFARFLERPVTEALRQLFSTLDADGDGKVDLLQAVDRLWGHRDSMETGGGGLGDGVTGVSTAAACADFSPSDDKKSV